MNDVSVIRVSRCGITRGTLYGKHVLTLIWVIMTGGSFKIVSNWAVLTQCVRAEADGAARERRAGAGEGGVRGFGWPGGASGGCVRYGRCGRTRPRQSRTRRTVQSV